MHSNRFHPVVGRAVRSDLIGLPKDLDPVQVLSTLCVQRVQLSYSTVYIKVYIAHWQPIQYMYGRVVRRYAWCHVLRNDL